MSLSGLSERLGNLKPFSKARNKVDEEDKGDEVDSSTVAGGGHAARQSDITRNQLTVSHALRSFLVSQNVLSSEDAGVDTPDQIPPALKELIDKPHINVPATVSDRSYPLPEYFISSSHNTYLVGQQLYGTSSTKGYETALNAGARCVEIDAWDNEKDPEEPKVTHGYTLVCETMRDFVDREEAQAGNEPGTRSGPIFLSLENHCGAKGQLRLVNIMEEVWGDRLLSKCIREKGHEEQQGTGEHVTLAELAAKIVVIVEYHYPNEPKDKVEQEAGPSAGDETEEDREARKIYEENEKSAPATAITPELAELGVYAQSIKPADNSWYSEVGITDPHHHLINISETGLQAHLPAESDKIARHNAHNMMRVYPKGTRINSNNLNPVPFWAVGAHICALNWQTFAAPLQLNEALFAGSDGFVLKPAELRSGGSGKLTIEKRKRLRLHAAGATNVPIPAGRKPEDIKPYLTCTLFHPDDQQDGPAKHKTAPYKEHKLGFLHAGENPLAKDPVWDETLEWEFDENELIFLRMLIKSDDAFAKNPKFAVSTVRLMYATPGWSFIRMLDLKGRETTCSLLVKIEVDEI
ncbi:1-phosphatidylinositol-4,5-bisphosphate phosphodiesterase [Exophiala viscosa]|uniref:1-phosphatidylinositol-4,5-bisphosphate phosphodiesterase n=1 Tax=Exophiala viscosa TaxID=2486360 RepID=UPI002193191B|nr:1-phosphatidylinositol-4,5-bisphosphate phosphodiesterase [Exophiala viscosa]